MCVYILDPREEPRVWQMQCDANPVCVPRVRRYASHTCATFAFALIRGGSCRPNRIRPEKTGAAPGLGRAAKLGLTTTERGPGMAQNAE